MQKTGNVYKLTALWAFSECSLGGIMHLFKIPFTGFFVGGFAVILIGLISFYSNQNYKTLTQATLLVLMVKAAVSPQSPPAAYFAVLFQGFIGAIIFISLGFKLISTLLFGVIAMVESSLQLIINKTIFYGLNFWKAIDLLFNNILNEFGLLLSQSFSLVLISMYVLLYAIWGLLLGYWCYFLPNKLSNKWAVISKEIESNISIELSSKKQNNFNFKWIGILSTLLFVVVVLYVNGGKIWIGIFLILRTIAIMAFLSFVVAPFVIYYIKKKSLSNQNSINLILVDLPKMKNNSLLAMQLASKNKNVIVKYKAFIENIIVITLYHES
jgi:hypothetical protein